MNITLKDDQTRGIRSAVKQGAKMDALLIYDINLWELYSFILHWQMKGLYNNT